MIFTAEMYGQFTLSEIFISVKTNDKLFNLISSSTNSVQIILCFLNVYSREVAKMRNLCSGSVLILLPNYFVIVFANSLFFPWRKQDGN